MWVILLWSSLSTRMRIQTPRWPRNKDTSETSHESSAVSSSLAAYVRPNANFIFDKVITRCYFQVQPYAISSLPITTLARSALHLVAEQKTSPMKFGTNLTDQELEQKIEWALACC